jgi:hypothetical protein
MKNYFPERIFAFVFVTALIIGLALPAGAAKLPKEILVQASTDSITTWDPSASYSTESVYMPNIYERRKVS